MSLHRYPAASLWADDARAAAGLAMTALPLAVLDMHWVLTAAFGAAAILFAGFLVRTGLRHITVIETGDAGIATHGPLGSAIAWPQLAGLRLRYYSTRRDREHGWMQLTLRGNRRRLRLESTLDGFDDVVGQACAAARRNGVTFDDATVENLLALGIDPGRGAPRTRWDLGALDRDEAADGGGVDGAEVRRGTGGGDDHRRRGAAR